MYAAVSRVSTLLTTQFTGVDFWMVGLNLFQAAPSVITQLDELMHVQACIGLARKFLRDEKQRKETGLVNAAPEPTVNLEGHTGPLLQAQNVITTLIRERLIQQMGSDPAPEPEPIEEGDHLSCRLLCLLLLRCVQLLTDASVLLRTLPPFRLLSTRVSVLLLLVCLTC